MQKLLISILALFMSTICAQADKKSIVLLQRIHNYAATIDTTNHASEVSYTYTRTTFNVERRNFLLMLVPTVYAISHGKQRLGRTSAKSRRRNDRNQTSHRDAKQHEHGRRNNRNAHGNNGKSDGQNAANADRPQGDRQQQRRQNKDNKRPVGNTDSAQRDARTGNSANRRRSRNNRQGNTDDRRQKASRSNGTASRNNGNRRNGSHRARQQGDYKKKRTAATSASTAPTMASSQHDSGITKLIKRPLRWLRSLGKK